MLLVVRCLTNNDLPSGAVFGTVIIARALIQGSLLSRPYLYSCVLYILYVGTYGIVHPIVKY